MERRLSAIFVADMVGYSRLMELDELSTLQRQRQHRDELIDPSFEQHQGRIIKTTGDGLLAEFPSVVEAVDCAVEIQRAMFEREAGSPEDQRIQYRVGINLGDVVHEDGDVYGDGVNVAARLEQMADPGGVCISGTAYDHLRTSVEVGYEDLGEVQVKNIERPIRAFRVLLDPARAGELIEAVSKANPTRWRIAAASFAVVLIVLAAWLWQRPDFSPADPSKIAFELPDKPSIAVLPFEKLSAADNTDFVANGLTDILISSLASAPKLFVIGKKSSFAYSETALPVSQIAEELGVRYLLGGSVQIAETSLRVSAHLVDTTTGQQLWARRFEDGLDASGIFDIQDSIVRSILVQLDASLVSGNLAFNLIDDAGDLEVYQLITQAISEIEKFRPDADLRAKTLLENAIQLNPKSASAHGYLSWVHLSAIFLGYSQDPAASLTQAATHAETALSLNPNYYHGHIGQAWLHLYAGQHSEAVRSAERALELLPGEATNAAMVGWILSASGDPERGETLLRYGLRTQPHPSIWVPSLLAFSLMMQGQYEEAQQLYKAALDIFPNPMAAAHLAVLSVLTGQQIEAEKYADLTREISPRSSVSLNAVYWGYLKDKAFLGRFLDALRQAGLPET